MIDITSGTPVVRKLASMAYARAFGNSVVLPNGQVVVIGGQTVPVPFSDDGAVLTPELWDPATEKFQKLAAMATPRTYHSVALLLPDGRVLSGGGGLCGDCTTNHPNVEILSPPYLLNADGTAATRPTISSAPGDARLGTTISVTTNTPVAKSRAGPHVVGHAFREQRAAPGAGHLHGRDGGRESDQDPVRSGRRRARLLLSVRHARFGGRAERGQGHSRPLMRRANGAWRAVLGVSS
ncbi:hypothetical protein ACU4GD_19340 [Cupriavidus basilensis]